METIERIWTEFHIALHAFLLCHVRGPDDVQDIFIRTRERLPPLRE